MPHRRAVLAALATSALAGCTDTNPPQGEVGESPTDGGETDTPSEATTSATGPPELDLREANVVRVEWDGDAGGDVKFSVTLYHDDEGEEGYANWWQVETTDDERLGRRELLHAHGTRQFTRSETVAVPADVPCVVVRGHDQTHGYGGRAAHVDLSGGAVAYVEQGPGPASFAERACRG